MQQKYGIKAEWGTTCYKTFKFIMSYLQCPDVIAILGFCLHAGIHP